MDSILQSAGDWLSSTFGSYFYHICYKISAGLCRIVGILDQVFSVMSGQTKVRYEGKAQGLIDVFFGNSIVEKVYWAMALIGILLCFVFAIVAVARKAVDSSDKVKQSLVDILTSLFKGIIIIISMTFIFNAVLSLSNKLLTQITYTFNHADSLGEESSIEFTDEQYAAMARVLDTVANYSLNTSYDSRYNLNNCYNEIRGDLQYLMQQGVFDFTYDTEDGNSWQSALQEIVNAADPGEDLAFDIYDDRVGDALLKCMKLMKTDSSFAPLKSYTRKYSGSSSNVSLDRVIFLTATMRAAANSTYNQNASLEDPLRGAYYVGEKNIYDSDQVAKDFKLSDISYIALWAVAFKLIWDLAVIIVDCVARVFNMIFLYLVAPPFIGVMPLDDGGKFKQWTTAFVVQCFGVFGTIIAMRVMLIFIPIIVDSDLVLFDNDILNFAGKVILILGGMSTAKRASSVITGILADNAGYQAILGSNMGDSVRAGMDHARNFLTGTGETSNLMRSNGLGALGMMGKMQDNAGRQAADKQMERNQQKQSGGTKDTGGSTNGTDSGSSSGSGGDSVADFSAKGVDGGSNPQNMNPLMQNRIKDNPDPPNIGQQPAPQINNQPKAKTSADAAVQTDMNNQVNASAANKQPYSDAVYRNLFGNNYKDFIQKGQERKNPAANAIQAPENQNNQQNGADNLNDDIYYDDYT